MSASPGAASGGGIDLSQFHGVFFEEAAENLAALEASLLGLDCEAPDQETLNAVFRNAHSVKGGAATFGFADVTGLTHVMETLLDRLRRSEIGLDPSMIDTLLASKDALTTLLARHAGETTEILDCSDLEERLRAHASGAAPARAPAPAPAASAAPEAVVPSLPVSDPGIELFDAPAAVPGERRLRLTFVEPPTAATMADVANLFAEVEGMGRIEPDTSAHGGQPGCEFIVHTTCSDDDLLDLLGFHVAREWLRLAPAEVPNPAPVDRSTPQAAQGTVDSSKTVAAGPAPQAKPRADERATRESATLRVGVEKVDQLINLVGELVITQAMLAQTGRNLDPLAHEQLTGALADLERNTRQLQEAVMGIRMIPMATVFSRFPRMLRDLAAKLGKQVELRTVGEAVELDKGMIEKITDPLTHLVRNAVDHGIEMPDVRRAKGKNPQGTLTLAAEHRGGSVVIEVRDDGAGLSREKLLKKALERGLAASESMSDAEVWNLIFEPGFSTAEQLTDVSGRGVGMDVVRRNIQDLGGQVEIASRLGEGTRIVIQLPLTLAIMDGMSVRESSETYILPLNSIVESIRIDPARLRGVAGSARLMEHRGDYLPVLSLADSMPVDPGAERPDADLAIVVEADGQRVALLVDELLGQHQVVVKNLEHNYRRVEGVSGATILGDGRVALILDANFLVRRAYH